MNNSFDQIQSDSCDFDARDAYEAQQEIWNCCDCDNEIIPVDGFCPICHPEN